MSVSLRGNGLLDTHVTWLDVQEKLQKTLKTGAILGEKRKIQRIGGTNGFLSRMGLVYPDWQRSDVKELPNKFVVKILSCLSLQEFSASVDGMASHESDTFNNTLAAQLPMFHNTEVTVYTIIEKYGEGRLPVPKIYGSSLHSETSKGFLVMEYFDNLEQYTIANIIGVEEARQILRAVAQLQAISPKMNEEEKESLPKDVFSTVAKDQFRSSNEDFLKDLETVGDGCFLDLLPEFRQFTGVLLSDKNMEQLDKWNKQQGLPDVVVHHDLWIANNLWVLEEGKLKHKALVDFQTANVGCCAVDLCGTLINLGGEDRRIQTEQLIKEFYGYLEEEMGGKVAFSVEKLFTSFIRFFPIRAYEIFKWASPYIEIAKKKKDETEAKALKLNLRMLIEDMMSYQNKSLNH